MTEPDDRETGQALRDMLSRRIDTLTPPEGLYESVRRRHRHRQQGLLAGVLVLAAAAVAVPAVALADRPAISVAGDRPGTPVAPSTGPPTEPRCVAESPGPRPPLKVRLPVQREAPGSLGGDAELVAAVLRAGWRGLAMGLDPRLDPTTARVHLVQEVEGQVVGVFTAADTARQELAEVVVQGPDRGSLVGHRTGGVQSPRPVRTTFAEGDAFVKAVEVCGRRHVVAAAPPGTTGRVSWTSGIGPDLRPQRTELAMPMRADGTGTVRVESSWDRIRLQRAGRVLFDGGPNGFSRSFGMTEADQDRVAAEAPGDGDPVLVRTFVKLTLGATSFPFPESDQRVLWTGRVGRTTVAFGTSALPNGVRYVTGSATSTKDALSGYYLGLLEPGALERTVLAFRAYVPGRPLVAFAVGGARAEAVLGTGEVARFALSGGGGVLETGAAVSTVRVYDADDRLIGEQVPDRGLAPVPRETPI